MKKLIILTFLFACAKDAFSQKEEAIRKFYLEGSVGGSSRNGTVGQVGVRAMLKHNWTTSISYHSLEMAPKNLPSNYELGYTILIVLPISDGFPDTKMNIYSFTAGKYFEAGRKIWFTTEAGLSIVNGEQLSFTPQPVEETYWLIGYTVSSNYAVKREKKTTMGFLLKADFNWAFLRFAGIGAGVFANLINSIQSPVGFEFKLAAGRMNTKRKHKA